MRVVVKRAAERALLLSGVARLARARRSRDVLVLAYHGIVPSGERAAGDASLHLPQREFARQLDAILRTHDVVPLDAAFVAGVVTSRPRVVVTFDDAYAGAVSAGVEELARRGLPATVFVAPALLGGHTWWDLLAEPARGAVPAAVRDHALDALAGRGDAILRWAAEQGRASGDPDRLPRIATETELARAAAVPGVTLGAHTWTHANLARLDGEALEAELARPLAWLRERFPAATVAWLAYPYGAWTREVEAAAARAGYRGAFRVEGGWVRPGAPRPYALPRFNVPAGLSLDGFRLRLAGLLGAR